MAIIMPVLVLLLFGTIEIGLLVKQAHSLNHVAREGARVASTGATTNQIQAHMESAAPALDMSRVTTTLEHRSWDETFSTWSGWTTMTDVAGENSAGSGDQIRVQLQYDHQLATGAMLAGTLNASPDNTVSLNAAIVSMRE
jgi:Flp pilus assembly protein TadG